MAYPPFWRPDPARGVTYDATATFDFNTSIGSPLDLDLLSDNFVDNSAGVAFDNMSLQIDVNEVPKVTKTFLSLTGSGGAETYFAAHPIIGLGTIAKESPVRDRVFARLQLRHIGRAGRRLPFHLRPSRPAARRGHSRAVDLGAPRHRLPWPRRTWVTPATSGRWEGRC